jgi:hypothetical protein
MTRALLTVILPWLRSQSSTRSAICSAQSPKMKKNRDPERKIDLIAAVVTADESVRLKAALAIGSIPAASSSAAGTE